METEWKKSSSQALTGCKRKLNSPEGQHSTCKSKGLEPVTWKVPAGRMVQARKQPVLQEVIHHLAAQRTPETAQMPTCWLVIEQTDLQWVENINGTEDSTLLNIQRYIDSSIVDDGPLHQPGKELSIFNLSLSIPEIYDVSNLHHEVLRYTRFRAAEFHMTHRNTIYSGMFLPVCLSSRRFVGNLRLPWGYPHCVCLVRQDIPASL